MECPKIKNEYCELIKATVSPTFCERCKGRHEMVRTAIQRSKESTEKKLEYPSLPTMAKSFGKALYNHAKSGFKKRTEAEQQKVMEICRACEFFIAESKIGPRCVKCGCCMSLKTRWAASHCKLGKW